MKNLIYIFSFFVILGFISCEDYFGSDSNVDPDEPIAVTANVILPQVQARLVYTYGGDFTRYLGLYTQHVDGISRQFVVYHNYGLVGSDVDQAWANMFNGTMNSNRELLKLAQENGFNHYAGMSLTIEAYTMLVTTDVWGDVPYSDAWKFAENGGVYIPTFDTQESIYNAIFGLLDQARALFAGDGGGSVPSSDDLIYGGNVVQWTKFCNVLEARAKIHLSKVSGSAETDALAALNKGGFDSSSDNASFSFGTGSTAQAPWYQYIDQRDDCEVGASYVARLEALNDPRVATYGSEHTVPGHSIFVPNQLVPLISYTEQEFIRAEALLSSDADAAYAAYLTAINSSFQEAALADAATEYDTYIAQSNVGVGASNLTLQNIIEQKYIALYTDPEVFNDWRRTGFPALSANSGVEIPRRLPYAETEVQSNTNTPSPATVTQFTRVWWDQ